MSKTRKDPRVDIVVAVMAMARFERLKRMLNVRDMRKKEGRLRVEEEAEMILSALDKLSAEPVQP